MDLGEWFRHAILTSPTIVAMPVAILAGLISFFSPCVVPLLPGYLSYTTGISGADLESARRGRVFLGSLLFVLGFTFVFVSYGALFGQVGEWLFEYRDQLILVMGALTFVLGASFLGLIPWFNRDVRIHRIPAVGLAAAPFLGVLFALGWSPCVGPALSAVLSLAMNEGSAARGTALAAAYSVGLGLPFIAAAIGFRKAIGLLGFVRRHHTWVSRLGGLMLMTVGLLLMTGLWDAWIGDLRYWASGFGAPV